MNSVATTQPKPAAAAAAVAPPPKVSKATADLTKTMTDLGVFETPEQAKQRYRASHHQRQSALSIPLTLRNSTSVLESLDQMLKTWVTQLSARKVASFPVNIQSVPLMLPTRVETELHSREFAGHQIGAIRLMQARCAHAVVRHRYALRRRKAHHTE